tara:strand:+ start:278 stop:538 length:261 start_codon:yes stop_codon:yes gene_type:complete
MKCKKLNGRNKKCFCLLCTGCAKKKKFTYRKASEVARSMNLRKTSEERRLVAYSCLTCPSFHVGHEINMKKQKIRDQYVKAVREAA